MESDIHRVHKHDSWEVGSSGCPCIGVANRSGYCFTEDAATILAGERPYEVIQLLAALAAPLPLDLAVDGGAPESDRAILALAVSGHANTRSAGWSDVRGS